MIVHAFFFSFLFIFSEVCPSLEPSPSSGVIPFHHHHQGARAGSAGGQLSTTHPLGGRLRRAMMSDDKKDDYHEHMDDLFGKKTGVKEKDCVYSSHEPIGQLNSWRCTGRNTGYLELVPKTSYVKSLYYYGNNVDRLHYIDIKYYSRVELMYLPGNKINWIQPMAYYRLYTTEYLFLHNNNLKKWLTPSQAGIGSIAPKAITILSIGNNPFPCDCTIVWLWRDYHGIHKFFQKRIYGFHTTTIPSYYTKWWLPTKVPPLSCINQKNQKILWDHLDLSSCPGTGQGIMATTTTTTRRPTTTTTTTTTTPTTTTTTTTPTTTTTTTTTTPTTTTTTTTTTTPTTTPTTTTTLTTKQTTTERFTTATSTLTRASRQTQTSTDELDPATIIPKIYRSVCEPMEEEASFSPGWRCIGRHTKIEVIPKADGLKSLTYYNTKLQSLPYESLQPFSNLKYINLAGNDIKWIEPMAFKQLYETEYVILHKNLLTTFLTPHQTGLTTIPKLKVLSLGGNPFPCNCSISWLWKDYRGIYQILPRDLVGFHRLRPDKPFAFPQKQLENTYPPMTCRDEATNQARLWSDIDLSHCTDHLTLKRTMWTPWSQFGLCHPKCGNGTKSRQRVCLDAGLSSGKCVGPSVQNRTCETSCNSAAAAAAAAKRKQLNEEHGEWQDTFFTIMEIQGVLIAIIIVILIIVKCRRRLNGKTPSMLETFTDDRRRKSSNRRRKSSNKPPKIVISSAELTKMPNIYSLDDAHLNDGYWAEVAEDSVRVSEPPDLPPIPPPREINPQKTPQKQLVKELRQSFRKKGLNAYDSQESLTSDDSDNPDYVDPNPDYVDPDSDYEDPDYIDPKALNLYQALEDLQDTLQYQLERGSYANLSQDESPDQVKDRLSDEELETYTELQDVNEEIYQDLKDLVAPDDMANMLTDQEQYGEFMHTLIGYYEYLSEQNPIIAEQLLLAMQLIQDVNDGDDDSEEDEDESESDNNVVATGTMVAAIGTASVGNASDDSSSECDDTMAVAEIGTAGDDDGSVDDDDEAVATGAVGAEAVGAIAVTEIGNASVGTAGIGDGDASTDEEIATFSNSNDTTFQATTKRLEPPLTDLGALESKYHADIVNSSSSDDSSSGSDGSNYGAMMSEDRMPRITESISLQSMDSKLVPTISEMKNELSGSVQQEEPDVLISYKMVSHSSDGDSADTLIDDAEVDGDKLMFADIPANQTLADELQKGSETVTTILSMDVDKIEESVASKTERKPTLTDRPKISVAVVDNAIAAPVQEYAETLQTSEKNAEITTPSDASAENRQKKDLSSIKEKKLTADGMKIVDTAIADNPTTSEESHALPNPVNATNTKKDKRSSRSPLESVLHKQHRPSSQFNGLESPTASIISFTSTSVYDDKGSIAKNIHDADNALYQTGRNPNYSPPGAHMYEIGKKTDSDGMDASPSASIVSFVVPSSVSLDVSPSASIITFNNEESNLKNIRDSENALYKFNMGQDYSPPEAHMYNNGKILNSDGSDVSPSASITSFSHSSVYDDAGDSKMNNIRRGDSDNALFQSGGSEDYSPPEAHMYKNLNSDTDNGDDSSESESGSYEPNANNDSAVDDSDDDFDIVVSNHQKKIGQNICDEEKNVDDMFGRISPTMSLDWTLMANTMENTMSKERLSSDRSLITAIEEAEKRKANTNKKGIKKKVRFAVDSDIHVFCDTDEEFTTRLETISELLQPELISSPDKTNVTNYVENIDQSMATKKKPKPSKVGNDTVANNQQIIESEQPSANAETIAVLAPTDTQMKDNTSTKRKEKTPKDRKNIAAPENTETVAVLAPTDTPKKDNTSTKRKEKTPKDRKNIAAPENTETVSVIAPTDTPKKDNTSTKRKEKTPKDRKNIAAPENTETVCVLALTDNSKKSNTSQKKKEKPSKDRKKIAAAVVKYAKSLEIERLSSQNAGIVSAIAPTDTSKQDTTSLRKKEKPPRDEKKLAVLAPTDTSKKSNTSQKKKEKPSKDRKKIAAAVVNYAKNLEIARLSSQNAEIASVIAPTDALKKDSISPKKKEKPSRDKKKIASPQNAEVVSAIAPTDTPKQNKTSQKKKEKPSKDRKKIAAAVVKYAKSLEIKRLSSQNAGVVPAIAPTNSSEKNKTSTKRKEKTSKDRKKKAAPENTETVSVIAPTDTSKKDKTLQKKKEKTPRDRKKIAAAVVNYAKNLEIERLSSQNAGIVSAIAPTDTSKQDKTSLRKKEKPSKDGKKKAVAAPENTESTDTSKKDDSVRLKKKEKPSKDRKKLAEVAPETVSVIAPNDTSIQDNTSSKNRKIITAPENIEVKSVIAPTDTSEKDGSVRLKKGEKHSKDRKQESSTVDKKLLESELLSKKVEVRSAVAPTDTSKRNDSVRKRKEKTAIVSERKNLESEETPENVERIIAIIPTERIEKDRRAHENLAGQLQKKLEEGTGSDSSSDSSESLTSKSSGSTVILDGQDINSSMSMLNSLSSLDGKPLSVHEQLVISRIASRNMSQEFSQVNSSKSIQEQLVLSRIASQNLSIELNAAKVAQSIHEQLEISRISARNLTKEINQVKLEHQQKVSEAIISEGLKQQRTSSKHQDVHQPEVEKSETEIISEDLKQTPALVGQQSPRQINYHTQPPGMQVRAPRMMMHPGMLQQQRAMMHPPQFRHPNHPQRARHQHQPAVGFGPRMQGQMRHPNPGNQRPPNPNGQRPQNLNNQRYPNPRNQRGPNPGNLRGPNSNNQRHSNPRNQRPIDQNNHSHPNPRNQRPINPGTQRYQNPNNQRHPIPRNQRPPNSSNQQLNLNNQPPSNPGQRPSNPGSQRPSNPGGQRPSNPGGQRPSNPGGQRPCNPGSQRPSNPGCQRPSNPGGQRPSNPGGQRPSNPGGQRQSNPGDQARNHKQPAPPLKEEEKQFDKLAKERNDFDKLARERNAFDKFAEERIRQSHSDQSEVSLSSSSGSSCSTSETSGDEHYESHSTNIRAGKTKTTAASPSKASKNTSSRIQKPLVTVFSGDVRPPMVAPRSIQAGPGAEDPHTPENVQQSRSGRHYPRYPHPAKNQRAEKHSQSQFDQRFPSQETLPGAAHTPDKGFAERSFTSPAPDHKTRPPAPLRVYGPSSKEMTSPSTQGFSPTLPYHKVDSLLSMKKDTEEIGSLLQGFASSLPLDEVNPADYLESQLHGPKNAETLKLHVFDFHEGRPQESFQDYFHKVQATLAQKLGAQVISKEVHSSRNVQSYDAGESKKPAENNEPTVPTQEYRPKADECPGDQDVQQQIPLKHQVQVQAAKTNNENQKIDPSVMNRHAIAPSNDQSILHGSTNHQAPVQAAKTNSHNVVDSDSDGSNIHEEPHFENLMPTESSCSKESPCRLQVVSSEHYENGSSESSLCCSKDISKFGSLPGMLSHYENLSSSQSDTASPSSDSCSNDDDSLCCSKDISGHAPSPPPPPPPDVPDANKQLYDSCTDEESDVSPSISSSNEDSFYNAFSRAKKEKPKTVTTVPLYINENPLTIAEKVGLMQKQVVQQQPPSVRSKILNDRQVVTTGKMAESLRTQFDHARVHAPKEIHHPSVPAPIEVHQVDHKMEYVVHDGTSTLQKHDVVVQKSTLGDKFASTQKSPAVVGNDLPTSGKGENNRVASIVPSPTINTREHTTFTLDDGVQPPTFDDNELENENPSSSDSFSSVSTLSTEDDSPQEDIVGDSPASTLSTDEDSPHEDIIGHSHVPLKTLEENTVQNQALLSTAVSVTPTLKLEDSNLIESNSNRMSLSDVVSLTPTLRLEDSNHQSLSQAVSVTPTLIANNSGVIESTSKRGKFLEAVSLTPTLRADDSSITIGANSHGTLSQAVSLTPTLRAEDSSVTIGDNMNPGGLSQAVSLTPTLRADDSSVTIGDNMNPGGLSQAVSLTPTLRAEDSSVTIGDNMNPGGLSQAVSLTPILTADDSSVTIDEDSPSCSSNLAKTSSSIHLEDMLEKEHIRRMTLFGDNQISLAEAEPPSHRKRRKSIKEKIGSVAHHIVHFGRKSHNNDNHHHKHQEPPLQRPTAAHLFFSSPGASAGSPQYTPQKVGLKKPPKKVLKTEYKRTSDSDLFKSPTFDKPKETKPTGDGVSGLINKFNKFSKTEKPASPKFSPKRSDA